MNLALYKILGLATSPLYRHAPAAYFELYSGYKRLTDARKLPLLRALVRPGDVCIDVGAHIGFYTTVLARLVGKGGAVYAFEPDAQNFARLQANTKSLPQAQLIQQAVSESTGQQQLFTSALLNVDHRMYQAAGERRKSQTVSTVSLDEFCVRISLRPIVIKMDIQGFEHQALLGAKQVLEKLRPALITEFWPWGLRQAGSGPGQVLELLQAAGYHSFLIDERTGCRPVDTALLKQGTGDYYDLLALPQERALPKESYE